MTSIIFTNIEWECTFTAGDVSTSGGYLCRRDGSAFPDTPEGKAELERSMSWFGGDGDFYVAFPWKSITNKKEFKIQITAKNSTVPLSGVKVTTDDGQSSTTGDDGMATFTDLTPGRHSITISADNFKGNTYPGEYDAKAEWDDDPRNDYIMVPEYSRKQYLLDGTVFGITVVQKIATRYKYTSDQYTLVSSN
jgi:hypothetical protein